MPNLTNLRINLSYPSGGGVDPGGDEEEHQGDDGQQGGGDDHQGGDEGKGKNENKYEGEIAEVPNTGLNTFRFLETVSPTTLVSGGFCLFVILGLIALKIHNSKKTKKAIYKPLKAKKPKIVYLLPVFSFVFFAINLYMNVFAEDIFNIKTFPSKNVTMDADILGTDNIRYVHDEIYIPSSSFGYSLSFWAEETSLKNSDGSETSIESITEPGALAPNTYGYTLTEPTSDTVWQPIPTSTSHGTLQTFEGATETKAIDIWYGVRAKSVEEGSYSTELSFNATTTEIILDMQEMNSDVCNALVEGETYNFSDTRDDKTYTVSKLKDGVCWMTSDLALELTTEEEDGRTVVGTTKDNEFIKLTSANTSLASSDWTVDNFTSTLEDWQEFSDSDVMNLKIVSTANVDNVYYYNFSASTASSIDPTTIDQTSSTISAEGSICPAGWELPSTAQYNNLITQYSENEWLEDPANYAFHGYVRGKNDISSSDNIYSGFTRNLGTRYDDKDEKIRLSAQTFIIKEKDGQIGAMIAPDDKDNIDEGYQIRCVAKVDSSLVIYDENTSDAVTDLPRPEKLETDSSPRVSTSVPTRAGYTFVGWSLEKDSSASILPGEPIVLDKSEVTLYAVWLKDVDDGEATLQSFTQEACLSLDLGVEYALKDARDDKLYSVSRLKDGNCWITQNLDLDLDSETALTPADTAIKEDWTPSLSTSTNKLEEWDYGDEVSGYCFMSEEGCEPHSLDTGNRSDGNYYDFTATTAGSQSTFLSDFSSGAQSICPKGWHLPLGENYEYLYTRYGIKTNDEKNLRSAQNNLPSFTKTYGIYSPMDLGDMNGINDGYVRGKEYMTFFHAQDSATAIIFEGKDGEFYIQNFGADPDYAEEANVMMFSMMGGSVRCVSDFDTTALVYDLNTTDSSAVGIPENSTIDRKTTPTVEISSTVPTRTGYLFAGWSLSSDGNVDYRNGDTLTIPNSAEIVLYAVWLKAIDNISTMQSFTPEVCETLQEGTYYGLKDSRDNKVYEISKLRDGNCWMTQNLDLKLSSERTLTPSDTNLSRDWTPTVSMNDTNPELDDFADRAFRKGTMVYYNFVATTADSSVTSGEITESICPKNWTLPSVGNFTSIFDEYAYSELVNNARFVDVGTYRIDEDEMYGYGKTSYWTSYISFVGSSYGGASMPYIAGLYSDKERKTIESSSTYVDGRPVRCVVEANAPKSAKAIGTAPNGESRLTLLYDAEKYAKDGYLNGETIAYVRLDSPYLESGFASYDSIVGDINRQFIKTVVVDNSFSEYRPTSTRYWFNNMERLETIYGAENINLSNNLNAYGMFYGDGNLTKIYATSDTDWRGYTMDSTSMFSGATSLSNFDPGFTNSSRAYVGEKDGILGYFTDSCEIDNSCPSETSSTPRSTSSNSSYSYNYDYGYSYDTSSLDEEQDKDDKDNKSKDEDGKEEKSEPLGVINKTKEEPFDTAIAIVIATSILLVLLGAITIIVLEKRARDDDYDDYDD